MSIGDARSEAVGLGILVTGVGGPLGVSIVKALRLSTLAPRIVVCDADERSVGLFRADAAHVLPHVSLDPAGYLAGLREVIRTERVALVCFGSEVEMEGVAPHREEIERETGVRLVVERPEIMRVITDKRDMVELLRRHALPVPDTVLANDREAVALLVEEHGFPVIIKPRRGSGSRRVIKAEDQRELEALCGYIGDAVVQEYLRPAEEEYTVGLYKSGATGYLGQISLRRVLMSGNTYKAEVVDDADIEAVSRDFAERLDVTGPANLQLRKTEAGVRIFEVNLRFSGSAVMRAWFGFNEPELAIRDLVLREPLVRPIVRLGYAFRFWEEIYLTPEEVAEGPPSGAIEWPIGARPTLF